MTASDGHGSIKPLITGAINMEPRPSEAVNLAFHHPAKDDIVERYDVLKNSLLFVVSQEFRLTWRLLF
jgi:hypothetical protein